MMEDCATSMSAPQGCNDDMGVVESFKEALKGRVGADRFRMWFTHGIEFSLQAQTDSIDLSVGQLAGTLESVDKEPVSLGGRDTPCRNVGL